MKSLNHRLPILLLIATSALALRATPVSAQTPISCNMVISNPGQYVLASDLTCTSAPGIQIIADDVHINLRGHVLSGPNVSAEDGAWVAIATATGTVSANSTDVTDCVAVKGLHIDNGTIRAFGAGVRLCAPGPESAKMAAHLNGINVTDNTFAGVQLLNSDDDRINGDNISENLGVGVTLVNSHDNDFDGDRVQQDQSGETIRACGGYLLAASSGNVIASNDVSHNGTVNGGFGILILPGSTHNIVRDSTLDDNQTLGGVVVAADSNMIQDNAVNHNTIFGILVEGHENTIKSNIAFDNVAVDLLDINPNCDDNTWKSNSFGKSYPACIQ